MASAHWSKVGGDRIIGVLDIGSAKTTCLIAAVGPWATTQSQSQDQLRVVGVAQQRSHGVTAGVITDLDRAEQVTRATIAQAETMAGVTLDDIVVSVSCGQLLSRNFRASADVASGIVDDDDLARLHGAGRGYAKHDGRSLIHLNHRGYRIDGSESVVDPRGMAAKRITADWHAVTADDAPIQNLLLTIERCYLRASHMFAAPYASGLATTTEEERQLGITCIDFGGGTTTLSVFSDGEFMFTDSIAMGANHITFDIARALQTPLAEAERIKALYGSVISAQSDEHETFSYPLVGEEDGDVNQTTKAQLSGIIRQRFGGLAKRIETRLSEAGVGPYTGDQVVITGGGSQLVGAGTYLSQVLGKRVRIAAPHALSGLPKIMTTPAFATAVGLLEARAKDLNTPAVTRRPRGRRSKSYIDQVGSWLKHGF